MLKRTSQLTLLLTQLLYLLALVPWYVVAQLSYKAYDPVVMAEEIEPRLFLAAVFLLPLFPLICSLGGWISFRRRRYGWAIGWTAFPLLLAAALIVFLFYYTGGGLWQFSNVALDLNPAL
ncbi:MAG: hypothetical protein M3Q45_02000 [Chloroflexota bacterium]|nr:hypothetical protein [Chloroflexota bacterium]